MRLLLRVLALVGFCLVCAGACSLDVTGELTQDQDGGTGGSGGVECWSGQKWCSGKCYDSNDPKAGCNATSCEPCNVPNANATCRNNQCAVDECLPGYADCDKNDFAPACEVDTQNNTKKCGGCVSDGSGEDCSLRGPTWICKQGRCEITDCLPVTTGDCDNDKTNGCEINLETDLNNCGFCTNACIFPHSTSQCVPDASTIGACMIIACDDDATGKWLNCNGAIEDGCEINASTDSGNCGTCGNTCTAPTNGIAFCNNGTCDFQCSSPYSKCGGACIDLSNSVGNCGSCGYACPQPAGSTASCSGGQCNFTCNGGLTKCNGQCVDTSNNVNYCGNCSTACSAPTGGNVTCVGGSCQKSCPGAQSICNNTCVDTTSNNSHCGGCNSPCTNERTCQSSVCKCPSSTPVECATTCEPQCCPGASCSPPTNGVCSSSGTCGCGSGLSPCSGTCVDKNSDESNCGACGTTCTNAHGTTQCASGACQPSCTGSWESCDGNPNNGCETDTNTSTGNCGSCGSACTNAHGGTSCSGGNCSPTCAGGYASCDGNPNNGCETAITADPNCGGCGITCADVKTGMTCQSGSCKCPTGWNECATKCCSSGCGC